MRIQLFPSSGNRPIELQRELTLVGRSDECDLKLDHKSVSKLHCVLFCDGTQVIVRDLGSTNGTRVNGQRVRRSPLTTDDQLGIAGCSFRIVVEDAAAHSMVERVSPLEKSSGKTLVSSPNLEASEVPPIPEEDGSDSVSLKPPVPRSNPLPDSYPD